ncbi:MAG: 16S rRNA (adenine(1518)-N(6)/adenine(1519)-N(6))-dimethyltransferase RsmA [Proteobacteria bacterium]|nr:16S rRNA (adenine(1518)-N(6)/adenine(1519)-N(6))-dimethyltransferase RsmA [Pseudomonadota bacterium]MDA1070866.1 16S rRNA (adenine(1518)-N(6)/adenine(1519)-N(6))-dimethyltransferase RsmA [Pseudomonadota bacterium]
MADLEHLPPVRDVADRFGLRARRSLGQNFLFDDNLLDRIARAAGDLATTEVVEVGPGPGGLTRALLRAGAPRVVAVEKDPRCIAALQDLVGAAQGRLKLVEADALSLELATLTTTAPLIAGNLPFNAATEILMRLLDRAERVKGMVLMFQREVGDRIAAEPGSKDYGRLSVMVQWRCAVTRCFEVPARAFVPPPKVQAVVLRLTPRAEPLFPAEPEALRQVLMAAFGQRRKTLRNAMSTLSDHAVELLESAGIDPGLRAERLTIAQFCALARAWRACEDK